MLILSTGNIPLVIYPAKCIISRPTTINNKKDMMCKSITVLFIDNYCVSHDILIRVGELMSRRDRTNRCEDPYPNEY